MTPRLQRIEAFLSQDAAVEFALLFGSRAAGTARADSDHDVAVMLKAGLDDEQRHQWLRAAYASLTPPDDLDLVLLNDAPPLLGHRALMGRPAAAEGSLALRRVLREHARAFQRRSVVAG